MRIFYICYENLSLQWAPTTHIKEVTEHLKKIGNDVILFAPNIGRYKSETTVRVIYVPTLKVRFIKEYIYYVCLFFYLFAYQIRLKADVFYVREMGLSVAPALVGFILRVPHILEINGIVTFDFQSMDKYRFKHKIFEYFQYINFLLAHKVVTVSENIKKELLQLYGNTDKVVYIENGVNTDIFSPKEKIGARNLLKWKYDGFYLLYIGSFYPRHGIQQIIQIIRHIKPKLPNVKLIMVGSGYSLESAVRLAKELRLTSHIDFVGEIDYENIPTYINASDVGIFFLTGSGKKYYGKPIKLYEYMSCGKPVITNEVYGEFVREKGIGIVISEKDYEQAADTIIQLLKDNALMNSMGENGRKLVVNSFTWEITTKKILNVCQTVV